MILKWLDYENCWTWRSRILEVTRLGFKNPNSIDPLDYGCEEMIVVGESDAYPMIIRVEYEDFRTELMALHAKQAYLCNDSTGSTVDTIINSV